MLARASQGLRLTVAALTFVGVAAATPPIQRADVTALVQRVEAEPASARVASALLRNARRSLDRARDARGAGDQEHGAMLEALAGEWAQAAADLARAAAAENKVAEVQRRASETETKVIRARALLEETVARIGRAREKLEAVEGRGPAPGAGP